MTLSSVSPDNTGIAPANPVQSGNELAFRSLVSAAINASNTVVNGNSLVIDAIQRTNYIRSFDVAQLSVGANTIAILSNAVIAWNNTTKLEVTGWPAKTFNTTSNPVEMANNFVGYLWIIWDGASVKDYAITSRLIAPAVNYSLLGLYSINGSGVVSITYALERFFESTPNYWRQPQTFLGSISAPFNTNTVYALPTNYHDVSIEYLTAATIRIKSGSRCRSTDDTKDIIFTSDYTIDMSNATPTSTTGGRTVAEAANTWYYLYVGLTSTGLPLAWLDTANLAGGGTPTNPAAYSSGRRQLKSTILNNSGSNIEPFLYKDGWTYYKDSLIIGSGLGAVGSWTAVSASAFIPPTSKMGYFSATPVSQVNANQFTLRETGSSGTSISIARANGASTAGGVVLMSMNASQQLDYYISAGGSTYNLYVLGYENTEVK